MERIDASLARNDGALQDNASVLERDRAALDRNEVAFQDMRLYLAQTSNMMASIAAELRAARVERRTDCSSSGESGARRLNSGARSGSVAQGAARGVSRLLRRPFAILDRLNREPPPNAA